MRNGWVKLHVSTLDNEIFRTDRLAWAVFTYLLLRAFDDKSQPLGKLATSRYQIAEALSSNHNAIYKAIKRLEKAKMVTTLATSTKTIVTICNWDKYQSTSNHAGNNKVTTQQQPSNSLNKIKDIRLKNSTNRTMAKAEYGNKTINQMVEVFEADGIKLKSQTKQRQAAHRIIKRVGDEKAVGIARAALAAQSDRYAPTIGDLIALDNKLSDLASYYKKHKPKEIITV